jgi:hypothetical protein
MMTANSRTDADMAAFMQWWEFYTEKFARISDSELTGYWYMYGRDSETPAPPRESAAYAAVNAEIDARDMQP